MVTKSVVNKLLAYCSTRESQELLKELVLLSIIEPQFIIDTIEEHQTLGDKGKEGKYIRLVLDFICEHAGITHDEIMSESRKRYITDSRRMAIQLIYSGTHLNKSAVARFFNKDHATVLHNLKGHANFMEVDKNYRYMYEIITARLNFAQYNTHEDGNENTIPLGADGLALGGDEQLEAESQPA
jgi:chromosomal replication initiation ATPase DnaA